MLMRTPNLLVTVTVAGALACGCADQSKETTGAIVGGAAGAVVGSQIGEGAGATIATIVGAIAGGALGSKIGRQMDEDDRQKTAQALEQNRTLQWTNPDTGGQYLVSPTETFESNGNVCRQYTLDSRMDGEIRQAEGVACRQPDGTWKVVE